MEATGGLGSGRPFEAEAGREEDARERLDEAGCVAFMALRKAKVDTRFCGIDCSIFDRISKECCVNTNKRGLTLHSFSNCRAVSADFVRRYTEDGSNSCKSIIRQPTNHF